MIEVSDQAAQVLFEALKESGVGPDRGLRLKIDEGGYTLDLDTPKEEDRVIRHSDTTLLLIDPRVERVLGDAVIDVELGPDEPRLTIRQSTQESSRGTSGNGAGPPAST